MHSIRARPPIPFTLPTPPHHYYYATSTQTFCMPASLPLDACVYGDTTIVPFWWRLLKALLRVHM